MKREELSDVIGGIDETLILEASRYDSTLSDGSSERIVHMKKKRIIVFALAAALILALGAGAYATGLFGSKPEIAVETVDYYDIEWLESNMDINELATATYEYHDNPITAEIEALLSEMDETEDASTRGYESVSEMEKAYGIELLKSDSGKDYAEAALWVEKTPVVYDYNDPIPTTNGVHLFGSWVSSVDGIRIYNYYYCCFNNPSYRQMHGCPLTGIDSVGEYDIRSLGVTASLISGWVDRDGQTERRFVAYFSYEGIDYRISAIPTQEQDITMNWLCALLETLHK